MVKFFTNGIILTIISFAVLRQGHTESNLGFCNVGTTTENECNACICTLDHVFECHPKPCNKTKVLRRKIDESFCDPGMFYVQNSTVCLCDNNGSWPHDTCNDVFKSLPTETNNKSCEPNSYILIDCNVCKCTLDGKIDTEYCTKHKCSKTNKTIDRRYIQENQVYGSCEPQNWYSLAPCQFCFCISENKLVCNTGHNYSKRLQLGSYNLSICGTDLLKDAMGLVPDKDQVLRFGDKIENKTLSTVDITQNVTTSFKISEAHTPLIKLNSENDEKVSQPQQRDLKLNESEEYYTEDSEDVKKPVPIEREGSSTKLPYEEDDNNLSDDAKESTESGNEMSFGIDLQTTKPVVAKSEPAHLPALIAESLSRSIEWSLPSTSNKDLQSEAFRLGDVLKPYLPVVLDKVFKMALRKSMVSVDPYANCTPGSTSMSKCNACFCLKNNKLLCTNNPCNPSNTYLKS